MEVRDFLKKLHGLGVITHEEVHPGGLVKHPGGLIGLRGPSHLLGPGEDLGGEEVLPGLGVGLPSLGVIPGPQGAFGGLLEMPALPEGLRGPPVFAQAHQHQAGVLVLAGLKVLA